MMHGYQGNAGQMPAPNPFGLSQRVGRELRGRLEVQQQRPGHQIFASPGVPIHNMSPDRGTPERIQQQGSPGSEVFQSPSYQNYQRYQQDPQESGGFALWNSMKYPDQQYVVG